MTATFDLRHAFARFCRSSMPKRPQRAFENDVDDFDDDDTSAGEGEDDGSGSGSGDNDSEDDDGGSSSLPAERDTKTKDVKDPDRKRLHEEAAKYRRERNEMRTQLEEVKRKLEGKQSVDDLEATVRSLRLELAFERMAVRSNINDIEAAWRLAADELKAVEVKDDKVDQKRLEEIVDHVTKRYPYLTDDYAPTENVVSGEAVGSSGRPVNGKRTSDVGLDRGALEKRFPALRRMR